MGISGVRLRIAAWLPLLLMPLAALALTPPQSAPAASRSAVATPAAAVPCVVWPFENRSGDASLDWIGESFVVALRQGLRDAPVMVLTRAQRNAARALAGAPAGVTLSHATDLRIAGQAGAGWMVAGWYSYDGDQFQAGAWVFDLKREHLVTLTPQRGPLKDLEKLQDQLGWAVREQIAPGAGAGDAPTPLPLPAYESYVRAQLAATPAARLKALDVAAHLAPHDPRVALALGTAELALGDNAAALRWLLAVPAAAPDAAQAQFSAGVAAYRLGQARQAAQIFRALGARFPLPAVAANLALAQAQQARPTSPRPPLSLAFPAVAFRQLQHTVERFNAAKLQALPAAQRVAAELEAGRRLQAQGGWDAAAENYQAVIAAGATGAQLAAAHAGLAAVWLERHDPARAQTELQAALAADPASPEALALQPKLAAARDPVSAQPAAKPARNP